MHSWREFHFIIYLLFFFFLSLSPLFMFFSCPPPSLCSLSDGHLDEVWRPLLYKKSTSGNGEVRLRLQMSAAFDTSLQEWGAARHRNGEAIAGEGGSAGGGGGGGGVGGGSDGGGGSSGSGILDTFPAGIAPKSPFGRLCRVVMELASSEAVYAARLASLNEHFAAPLRAMERYPLATPVELDEIFGGKRLAGGSIVGSTEALGTLARSLSARFTALVRAMHDYGASLAAGGSSTERPGLARLVADAFLHAIREEALLVNFSSFINGFDQGIRTLSKCMQRNNFKNFVDLASNEPRADGQVRPGIHSAWESRHLTISIFSHFFPLPKTHTLSYPLTPFAPFSIVSCFIS